MILYVQIFLVMYSICDPVCSSDVLKVSSDVKKKTKKKRPTNLPNLMFFAKLNSYLMRWNHLLINNKSIEAKMI